jgi:dihydroneopterin aldolase/2-amino-4-hydroxy-6-hydroxymethyldihydropteridine diphosphokinase
MDRILVDDLRVMCVIGALAHEREAAQPLRIDLSVGVDLADAGRSDDLDDTVNYGLVAERVTEMAMASKYVLLERLATEIADIVLSFDRVDDVEVTVTKLRPPVPNDLATTAVHIARSRAHPAPSAAHGHTVIVALGSNLGDREAHLRLAVDQLDRLGQVTAMSDVYETEPIGGPDEQGAYLNMVAVVATALDPFAFLRRCQRIEVLARRERLVHWGPRTLDVDVLFFDDVVVESPELSLPHPRVHERRFVLAPLADVAPERVPDGWQESLPPAEVIRRGPLVL